MKRTLKELADLVGGTITDQPDLEITGITSIEDAGPGQLTFALGGTYLEKAAKSNAAAVIVPENIVDFPKPILRVSNPKGAFAQLLELFSPQPSVTRGVHPACVVHESAVIGQNVALMPCVVVERDTTIGDNTILYPGVYVGERAAIGENCIIYPNVTIREGCRIGDNVIIHSSTVIGSDGFGFVTLDGHHRKVPQVGIVVIEDDVEIGACVAIDRATTGETVVRRGTKIDNLVHLAHNVVIGEDCFIVAQTGIAGSTKVGHHVTFAGQTGCIGHVKIGDNCVFAAKCGIISDVPPNSFYAGFPARPHKEWLRTEASAHKLPDLMKKVRDFEKRLAELEKNR